ncbi:MAG: DUF2953 domain-containing protein [Gammaproteobacteria bacterium]|nr:DUF2953 domain-containing protein [Gammaproteobacteria bacterium]
MATSLLLSIVCLLVLLIVLLAVPVSLSFCFSSEQQKQGFIHFKWLFGLVNFKTNFPDETESVSDNTQAQTQKEKPVKTKPAKTKAAKATHDTRGFVTLLKQSSFRRHIMRFIKQLLRASHARDLYLRLRIGLGEPADTGMLWAVMGPVSSLLRNLQGASIELEADFIDAVLEIEGQGQFHLIPLQFIALVIMFILSPTTIRAWNTVRQAR